MAYIGAGRLDQPLEVLELRQTSEGTWEWVPIRRAWALVEQTSKTNLFSKVGVGARDAAIVLRTQPLTLHHTLRWKGQHLLPDAPQCAGGDGNARYLHSQGIHHHSGPG